jgi:PKHD-type hydroxylase
MHNPTYLFKKDNVETWAYHTQVFSPEECQQIIKYGKSLGLQKGVTADSMTISTDPKIRKSNVSWINPNDSINWVYERIQNIALKLNEDYFKFHLIGFCEGFQFTEYEAPSGHYSTHIDKWFNGPVRKLSITIQLSDPSEYEGGNLELFFANDPVIVSKEQGLLAAFPSYALHGVTPVTKGTRYSLVAWISGDPFK